MYTFCWFASFALTCSRKYAIEMHGESLLRGLHTSRTTVSHMTGCGTERAMQWCLNNTSKLKKFEIKKVNIGKNQGDKTECM